MYFSPCRELSVLPLVNTKARDFEFKKISRRQMTMWQCMNEYGCLCKCAKLCVLSCLSVCAGAGLKMTKLELEHIYANDMSIASAGQQEYQWARQIKVYVTWEKRWCLWLWWTRSRSRGRICMLANANVQITSLYFYFYDPITVTETEEQRTETERSYISSWVDCSVSEWGWWSYRIYSWSWEQYFWLNSVSMYLEKAKTTMFWVAVIGCTPPWTQTSASASGPQKKTEEQSGESSLHTNTIFSRKTQGHLRVIILQKYKAR